MKRVVYQNEIVFFLLFLASLLITSVALYVLPERFFYDAKLIVTDPHGEEGWIGSYPLIMLFYKLTMLGKLPLNVVGILQLLVYFFILYQIGVPKDFEKPTLKNSVVYLAFLMIAIFIAMPSKEFLTYIFIAHLLYVFRHRQINFQLSWLYVMAGFVVFGVFFRPYFALVPVLTTILYFISKIKYPNRILGLIFNGLLMISLFSITHYLLKGEFFSEQARILVNSQRTADEDANSMIVPPFENGSWWGEILDNFYAFFPVNFPITEVKHFLSPQILMFIVWQIVLIWILLVRFSWVLKDRKNYRLELWLFLILISYLVIQAAFEPDLGSAVRHKIGVFPLLYYLLYYDDFKRKV